MTSVLSQCIEMPTAFGYALPLCQLVYFPQKSLPVISQAPYFYVP